MESKSYDDDLALAAARDAFRSLIIANPDEHELRGSKGSRSWRLACTAIELGRCFATAWSSRELPTGGEQQQQEGRSQRAPF